jgi:molybdopterin molybdotransferase
VKSVEAASAEILAAFAPLGEEQLPLLDALGRFTAGAVHAGKDLPPFDNSAMDGYALRARDVAQAGEADVELPVRGESRAGGPLPPALEPRSVMRIFTGAPLPAGADAVQLQEKVVRVEARGSAREHDAHVRFSEAVAPNANVRRRGSDVAAGELVLSAQSELGAGEIALLASLEQRSVRVHRRPRVAIVCTGDELRDLDEPERPGSIVNSNAYALSAQVSAAGAEPVIVPKARDTREDVARALRAALREDVVVLSGGVSVGDYDVVRDGLADAGVELAFWAVRMKPGKPVSFARHGAVPVLGLPGNPVSAWVTFELFVRPGLRRMLGEPRPQRPRIEVLLEGPLKRTPGRTEFARARLVRRDGQLFAQPLARQSSGALSSMVNVDALLEIPAERAELAAGTAINAILIRELRI